VKVPVSYSHVTAGCQNELVLVCQADVHTVHTVLRCLQATHTTLQQYVKSIPSHKALRFISPQPGTSLHCQTMDTGLVHRTVCLFTSQHRAYPRRDGQAELTWVTGYIPRWFTHLPTITHPSTNYATKAHFNRT